MYCRPSCASRPARRENVHFHSTFEAAEQACFRPYKWCQPNDPGLSERHAAAMAKACRLIEAAEEPLTLDALAEAAGMSRFHIHRVFKSTTRVTPKAYRAALLPQPVRSDTVTEAIYAAGFNSNGRFYAASSEILGMTPTSYRAGGTGASIHFAVGECSLGSILVSATGKGVCAILLGDDPDALVRELQDRFPKARLIGGDKEFKQVVAKIVGVVETPEPGFDLPLDVQGTAFQRRVWQALREIPIGLTASYKEIADRIGASKAVRAVARACASNAVAVVIPCHRVVRVDGALSGYRLGVERKRVLLEREAGRSKFRSQYSGQADGARSLPR